MWDVDGNEYVDYLLGQGPNFLGHARDEVVAAVTEACTSGTVFGAQHPLEVEAAEAVCSAIGWADQVRFGLTGTEAVQAALRLARAATGRTLFVRFHGHYHGWLDNVLINVVDGQVEVASDGQLPSHLADSIAIPWNDLDALRTLLDKRAEDIAAIIMEPIMLNSGSIEPLAGYLEGVRELCDQHGTLLIFDEIISGFRVALGGAAERYGVLPDLATYGKAMAGGWPVSAVAGRLELMERFGNASVNHSGTFNAYLPGAAATVSAIELLKRKGTYERVSDIGSMLIEGLRDAGARHGVPLRVQGPPMAFHVSFGDFAAAEDFASLGRSDVARYRAFTELLVQKGVWVTARGIWYVSTAHSEADVEETLSCVESALVELTA
jgi:glutamate-1-semialdehyde 2,1-aminomutase